jgi:hypothetical protein
MMPPGLAAPERIVNRAEMAALLDRAERSLRYGHDCGAPLPATDVGGLGASLLTGGGAFAPRGVWWGMGLAAALVFLLSRHRKSRYTKP